MTTTPTERRLAITPEKCKVAAPSDGGFRNHIEFGPEDNTLGTFYTFHSAEVGHVDGRAHARFFVDAHNTFKACGLKPSELLAKLKQAEDVVVHMVSAAKYHFKHGNDTNLDKQTDIADAFLSTLNLPQ